MVNWSKVDRKIDGVRTESIEATKLLDLSYDEELNTMVPLKDTEVNFNIAPLVSPLGEYGRALLKDGDKQGVRDSLSRYWAIKGLPKVRFEFAEVAGDLLPLRSRVVDSKNGEKRLLDINGVVAGINKSFKYDRAVIGADGAKMEFQFLNTGTRREVKEGDFVDGGMFVTVNGSVKISAGLNRLVCNNGLTERFYLMGDTNFEGADELMQRSAKLLDWLTQQTTHKIENIRELSVVLNGYAQPLLNRFWKSWSERIGLGELTSFDVINDLTSNVNQTLSGVRYKVLSMYEDVTNYQEKECRCPVCSASVEK